MRKIRAISYGVGAMGKLMIRFMVEKGVDVVGAIGHVSNVGKDVGEVAGLGYPINVKISDKADEILSDRGADIAVVAVFTEMERCYAMFRDCAEHGLNVISIADESLYPWRTNPELTSSLDKIAKEHGVTITGSGFQDIFLTNIVTLASGAQHNIESISGLTSFNIDDFGPLVREWNIIGGTPDDFYKWVKGGGVKQKEGVELNPFRICLEAIVAGMGLSIKKIEQRREPLISDEDIEAKTIGKTIKKGLVIGSAQIGEIETAQGIKLRLEGQGKLYKKDEVDVNKWWIKGEPNTYIDMPSLICPTQTCCQVVNRIPDVINAEPGYVTIDRLPMLKYRAFPLERYLKE